LVTTSCLAQTNTLSLDNAIGLALNNRYDLKIQKVNTQVSEKQQSEVVTRSLPQITSDLDMRYNSQLQTNIIPGSALGRPNSSDIPIKLGAKYNTTLAFNLNQPVYNPTNISDRKISNLQAEYQRQNETITEINIKQEVTESYFSALLWKEKVKLSEENVKRATEIHQLNQTLSGSGQVTSYDVQRSFIDLENAKAVHEQNKKNYELSINDLLYKISTDSIKNPELSDHITDLMARYEVTPSNTNQVERIEIRQEKIQSDIYKQNINKQNLLWFPTVSVYGNYTFQYLNSNFTPLDGNHWFPYNYIGLKASIPIFDGGLKSKTAQEYQLRVKASNYRLAKLSNDYEQEVYSAQTNLDNTLSDLNYQKKNLELIENLYSIDNDRFKNGTIKQTDLNTTYYTMLQTQTNYTNAVYNYLIAVIRYKKSLGAL